MKLSLKLFLLAVAIIVMNGCSTQQRAERRVRRAVELCPELVQVKAHHIDTDITVPAFTDRVSVPFGLLLAGDSVTAKTDNGSVTAKIDKETGMLDVTYDANETSVHYSDSVSYSQVVIREKKPDSAGFWSAFSAWIVGAAIGLSLVLWLLRNALKNNSSYK